MRTPLARSLRRFFARQAAARRTGLPVEVLREAALSRPRPDPRAFGRRGFLQGAAAVAAGALVPWFARCSSGGGPGTVPRIAVVGGGLAGLSAALALKDAGLPCTVYDASNSRVGGRTRSDRPGAPGCGSCHTVSKAAADTWADGQSTDVFGELIDTQHVAMQALAARFRLPLVDLLGAQPAGSADTLWFGGAYYPVADADRDFAAIYPALKADLDALEDGGTWDDANARAKELDALSLRQWIDGRVPGGSASRLGQLISVAYAIEYGADAEDLSALEMIWLLAGSDPASLQVFGESDEAFHLEGGIERLPLALGEHLGVGTTILLDHRLESVSRTAAGAVTLSFAGRGTVEADYAILAIPFAALRTLDFARAGFDALKVRAINELGAGRNGKMHLQFTKRLWTEAGPWGLGNGNTYADTGYQATWEATRGAAGTSGILVAYSGGSGCDGSALTHAYGNATNPDVLADAQRFLQQIEPVFPGLTATWNGRAQGSMAHLDPLWNGSYAYWRVGQATLFGGYERVRQGNILFAGEHTSVDWQGFMEGAVTEGVAAAEEILADVRPAALSLLERTFRPGQAA